MGGATIAAAMAALDKANEVNGTIIGAATLVADPRPAGGFFVILIGAASGAIASLVTLVSRRHAAPVRSPVVLTVAAPVPMEHAGRVPLPDRTPGWHVDPANTAGFRWWDGTRWAEQPMSAAPLPAPSGWPIRESAPARS